MSITKSQTEKIGSIFNGNRFIIPTYQRKYSWTDTERKALWQDIEESLNDKMNHFVGTLITITFRTFCLTRSKQRRTPLKNKLKCLEQIYFPKLCYIIEIKN